MHVAGLQARARNMVDKPPTGIAALAVPHQLWFCLVPEVNKAASVFGVGRTIRRKTFDGVGRLLERQPAFLLCGCSDHNTHQTPAARLANFATCPASPPHLARPRSSRSRNSSGVSNVVAGITTTPSFIAASMVSHNGRHCEQQQQVIAALQPCARKKFCD